MKVNIFILIIALFAMINCSSAGSAGKGINDYQYSAGSYYVIQDAKNDYVDSEKFGESEVISKNPIRICSDLLLFPFNIFYFAFQGETLFGTFRSSEKEFNRKISALQLDPAEQSLNTEDYEESNGKLALRIYGDLFLAPLNLFYFIIADDTLLGSIGQIERKSSNLDYRNRVTMTRYYLLKAGTTKKQMSVTDTPLSISQGEKDYSFTSDKIMYRFDAETFGQILTDANLVLDDLDLSAEDVEELKQNGYLDFVEDDAKSIPTFDVAPPVKGKKK
ncbi:hypothetical protein [Leptospira alexanderi]|uniref:hypothetical protein n=1 Tax=Leptospira alexanderi TaxID=100053 RepID=UPI00099123BE|nr:hypothetical protein [Leptospira alexanderi]